jgi:hypothetical protein
MAGRKARWKLPVVRLERERLNSLSEALEQWERHLAG